MLIFESALVNLLKALRSLGDHLPNISQKGEKCIFPDWLAGGCWRLKLISKALVTKAWTWVRYPLTTGG